MPNVYNRTKADLLTAKFSGLSVGAMLVTTAYTYDPDDDTVADIVANELSVAGYARQAVTFSSVSTDDLNDRAELLLAEVEFPALTAGETYGHLILFDDTDGPDSNRELLARFEINGGTGRATAGVGVIFRFNGTDPGEAIRIID